MKIVEGVYLIGSGNFGISHETDCNVYLVGCGDRYAIIDSGSGILPEKIIHNVSKEGINKEWIKYLILTHSHWDHGGGCLALVKAFNCEICAHKIAAEGLNKHTESLIDNNSRYEETKIKIEIDCNTKIDLNELTLRFMHTPGHSPDSISIYGKFDCGVALFCGDTAAACGKGGVISNNTNLEQYTASIKALYELKSNALFPGHGIFTLRNSAIHLQMTYEKMRSSWYEVFPAPTPFNPSWWKNYFNQIKN